MAPTSRPQATNRTPAGGPARSQSWRRLGFATAALVVVGAVVTSLLATRDGGGSATSHHTADSTQGVVHVHGLGVDPADGQLYAATHTGLFVIPEQGAGRRVADRVQDVMGFTVVGPRQFLGSGHPNFRENLPSRLGLIGSADAGATWQPLSLMGEADFHALAAVHGQVYGYESGASAFMVSTDRKTWQTRSTLEMRDFAVSPTDPNTVLATTPRGVVRSTDGGRSWAPLSGAPLLEVVSWRADGLWGIEPDGRAFRARTETGAWEPRGSVGGEPEAMTAVGNTVYTAVADQGIMVSKDAGATWQVRYRED